MSTLCRFVLPSALSTVEDACVAEFNDYKKRIKEISHNKSSHKRSINATGGMNSSSSNSHDSSQHHQKDSARNPEQAKEAAKKLVQSGAIKVQAQGKDHGFKRATSSNAGPERLTKKLALTPNTPSTPHGNPFQPVAFVSASSSPKFVNRSDSSETKRRVINYDDADNYS